MTPAPFSYRGDSSVPAFPDDQPILIFDGKCALCSATVQFTLRHDRQGQIRFIVAQSPLGEALYRHFGLNSRDYETNILIEDGRALTMSESSIRLMELIGWPWSLAAILRLLPRGLRDFGYEVIARNRIRWFGARDICYLPSPEERARFIG